MAGKKNLCAMIPEELHARVLLEKEELGKTLGEYVEQILNEHFENGGSKNMKDTKTIAFQISLELNQRLREHLAQTGQRLNHFMRALIEDALRDAEEAEPEDQTECV